jgi:hypothetical protein
MLEAIMSKKKGSKQHATQGGNRPSAGAGEANNQQQKYDRGGHAGMGAHGGQQSGGLGGQHGGDLHDVGSGQSGMTGGGMGGNTSGSGPAQEGDWADEPGGSHAGESLAEPAGGEAAEIQQSVQREGMGNHRHSNRGNAQAMDVTDADDLGSHDGAAPDANRRDKSG